MSRSGYSPDLPLSITRKFRFTPASSLKQPGILHPGMLQEVFQFGGGDAHRSGNALARELSKNMADRIEIFLPGLKRRSNAEAARRHADREDVPD